MRVKVEALEDKKLRQELSDFVRKSRYWNLKDLWLETDGPHREALKMKIVAKVTYEGQTTPAVDFTLSSCNFAKFIDHCGISSVQGVHIYEPLGQIWMDLIEDFLFQNGYSAIIAADTKGVTYNFIMRYGKHWKIVSEKNWINRRMGAKHPMVILVRYLNENPPEKMGNLGLGA